MGSALFSIMAVALGITYGWQPDPGGGEGAVQYIVQISPDRLERLESLGEITSTIDPAVRGRVTQVVVRVGSGPVPKIDPISSLGAGVSLSDAQPVPIPQMQLAGESSGAVPIAGIAPGGKTSLMKPQTGGFSLPPSVADTANGARDDLANGARQTLRDTAQNAANQFRQAGGQVAGAFGLPATDNRAANTARNNPTGPNTRTLVPPPSPNRGALSFATSGQAGNPSTDASGRDATYRNYSERQRNPAPTNSLGFPTTGGSSGTAPRNDLRNTPRVATAGAAGNLGSSEFVGPTLPAGSTFNVPSRPSPIATNDNRSTAATNPSGFGRIPDSLQGLASQNNPRSVRDRAPSSLAAQGITGGQNPLGPTLPQTASRQGAPLNSLGQTNPRSVRETYDPRTMVAADVSSQGPDPRLNVDQLEAGGWSVSGGRLYDRYNREIGLDVVEQYRARRLEKERYEQERIAGQRLEAERLERLRYPENTSRLASRDPAFATTDSRGVSDPRIDQRTRESYPTLEPGMQDPGRFASARESGRRSAMPDGYDQSLRPIRSAGNELDRTTTPIRRTSVDRLGEIASPSDRQPGRDVRDSQMTDRTTSSTGPSVTHTTGPLVHGILLFSAIANCYLFLWLRNIRVRYRDLVTSRRVAEAAI